MAGENYKERFAELDSNPAPENLRKRVSLLFSLVDTPEIGSKKDGHFKADEVDEIPEGKLPLVYTKLKTIYEEVVE